MSLDKQTKSFQTRELHNNGMKLEIIARKANPKGYDIGMYNDEDINNAMKQCNLFVKFAAKEHHVNHDDEWKEDLMDDYLDAYNNRRLGSLVMGSYASRPVDRTGKD